MNLSEYSVNSEHRQGEMESFEKLFRDHYRKLCSYACLYVYNPDDAEGIVKDVFIKIWENRQSLEIKTSQTGYLYVSVRNQCINFLNRERKKRQEIMVNLPEDSYFSLASDIPDISDEMAAKELEVHIKKLIEALPGQCREIFMMSRFDDLSYEEIAQALNITTGTVKTQIFRALNKIRTGLSDYLTLMVMIWSALG